MLFLGNYQIHSRASPNKLTSKRLQTFKRYTRFFVFFLSKQIFVKDYILIINDNK